MTESGGETLGGALRGLRQAHGLSLGEAAGRVGETDRGVAVLETPWKETDAGSWPWRFYGEDLVEAWLLAGEPEGAALVLDALGATRPTWRLPLLMVGTRYFVRASSSSSLAWSSSNVANSRAFSVQVNPVPEPGTWAALGLGSLALLKRRERG